MRLNPLVMMRREFDGNGIVFDPENNKAMSLNATGTLIWEAIAEGLNKAQITEKLTAAFDVNEADAARDVETFLVMLKNKGLLADE